MIGFEKLFSILVTTASVLVITSFSKADYLSPQDCKIVAQRMYECTLKQSKFVDTITAWKTCGTAITKDIVGLVIEKGLCSDYFSCSQYINLNNECPKELQQVWIKIINSK